MGVEKGARIPKWIFIGTAIAGLITAALTVAVRYYEIRKARAESEIAESARMPVDSPASPPGSKPSDVPQPKSLTDQERIQGRWDIVSSTGDEQILAGPRPTDASWTFRGNELSGQRKIEGKDERCEGTFTFRGAGGEGLFDYAGTNWRGKLFKYRGLYRFTENQLNLCFVPLAEDDPNNRRADSFVAGPRSGRILLILRKAYP